MSERLLVFIPTYNERENVERMARELLGLPLPLDVLFMDDGSPDGTGAVLDGLARENDRLRVIHRAGKSGVGSAHLEGIRYAYERGYTTLITMDCDFTHSPGDIPRLVEAARDADVVVGSRWLARNSLPGWNRLRRFLTNFGHFLTRNVLAMPYDATGAFRVYRLDRIERETFDVITSRSYSFFFESLFVLVRNGCSVNQVPIVLPARTYGHSKMALRDAARSAWFLARLRIESAINPGRFRRGRRVPLDPALIDGQDWDSYWRKKQDVSGFVYEMIAAVYRGLFIRPNLEHAVRGTFEPGSKLLHAGCGSGQVDLRLHGRFEITAIDISPQALYLYSQNNPRVSDLRHASIFSLPFEDGSFDGVYNLGVMEHFTRAEIQRIMAEFRRVLRPGGRLLMFWPHRRATSVIVLGLVHRFLRSALRSDKALHPPEVSLLGGRNEARAVFADSGFTLDRYHFGLRDLFVQAVLVGSPREAPRVRSLDLADLGLAPEPPVAAVPSPRPTGVAR